ncbi:hypothetical protein CMI37_17040 [Candidatus Pacearchaeota archaeon]|nr:hypothetical protein [Candidatus Pacearchaeota archaeon]|tara:strand:+ start:488 stop:718 length:231 start_codon:yes stop_codon:yes gene_type:complete
MTIHQKLKLLGAIEEAKEVIISTRSRCDEALITEEIEHAKYVTINKGTLVKLLEGIQQLRDEVDLSDKLLKEEELM